MSLALGLKNFYWNWTIYVRQVKAGNGFGVDGILADQSVAGYGDPNIQVISIDISGRYFVKRLGESICDITQSADFNKRIRFGRDK